MAVSGTRSDEARARAAEREANQRIARSEERVKQTSQANEERLSQLRDQFERQYTAQSVRNDEALQNEQSKGYEALGKLKKNFSEQIKKTRNSGEHQLGQTQAHYRDAAYQAERRGSEQLKEMQDYHNRAERQEHQNGEMAIQKLKSENEIHRKHTQRAGEDQLNTLKATYAGEIDSLRERTGKARQDAETHYTEYFQETLNEGQGRIDELMQRTNSQLNQMRKELTTKLSAYQSRAGDPFYRLMDLGLSLSDRGDHFLLTASVPEHEQKGISVSVKGDHVVVSGYRSNSEKVDRGRGHSQTTANHQAFTETLPLGQSVVSNQVTKEFHGDRLIVTIPKKKLYGQEPEKKKQVVDVPRISRPQFPENLGKVMVDPEPDLSGDPEDRKPAARTKGSGTLGRG